jgi:Tol biopolymer transport system component
VSVSFANFLQFSADGKRLLFVSVEEQGVPEVFGVWRVDSDGSNLVLLAEGSQPAWQPQR